MKQKIKLNNTTILITGAAGFIGSFLVLRLLEKCEGTTIIGIDNMNHYYDVQLKKYRLSMIDAKESYNKWIFREIDIIDRHALTTAFQHYKPEIVVNLAAQAGVRYSITNPETYISSNIDGFYNILECCRSIGPMVKHLVYASSSSVYGGQTRIPFRESDPVDNPVSLYAATKKCNELLAYSYAKLYNIPSTGLRFFTVYGPVGRPDMAYYKFADKLRLNDNIDIYNYGNCKRDFTYIDDIINGVIKVMQNAPAKSVGLDGLPVSPYDIYNIGNSHPESLMDFVYILSDELKRVGVLPESFDIRKKINLLPMQAGDVPVTYADVSKIEADFGYRPQTKLSEGLRQFAEWYAEYNKK